MGNKQLDAGEGAYDIECLEISYLARFAAYGGLTNLAQTPYNGLEAGRDLVPYAMSNATMTNGSLLAMPLDIAPAVLYYRNDIADELEVDLESLSSWAAYISIGQLLTRDLTGDDIPDQFALPHYRDMQMLPLNGGNGAWLDVDGHPYRPQDRFMDALQYIKELATAGITAGFSPWSQEWNDCFKYEQAVTLFSGNWMGGHFENWMCPDLAGNWRITYLPDSTYASFGGTYLGIPEQKSECRKELAWEIVKYLCTNAEAQLIYGQLCGGFPALTSVYADPVMSEPAAYFGDQHVREIFRESALNIPEQKITEYDFKAKQIFINWIDRMIAEDLSVTDTYNSALAEMLAQM